MTGRSQTDTSITYVHNAPASFKSKFLQVLMSMLGKKKGMEKALTEKKFASEAAKVPNELATRFMIQEREIDQRKLWTFKPNESKSTKVIVYIHGGGYIANLTKYDWSLVQQLLVKTGCSVVVPDYPLAPASNYKDVYEFFDSLYLQLLSGTLPQDIIFMGNSAGGGIALGFAQKLRNENRPQPAQIILNSPWLDITMSNPGIVEIDKKDKLLGIKGLKMAGQTYAAGLDPTDYRVSPLYGDCSGLGKISLFIGTHDLFLADARKFKEMMRLQNIPFNYFEYPKMFHVWVALTSLKESRHAVDQIAALVKAGY